MRDWLTSSGIKDVNKIVPTEQSGEEKVYKTTSVKVKKAKSKSEPTFDRKSSEDSHDYNVSEKAFLTKKRAALKSKAKRVTKNDKD